MRIGYPCINNSIKCTANKTFRLKSYSKERLIETVEHNLNCLSSIFGWNLGKNILFFRMGSDLVPFASHPICKFNWEKHFEEDFKAIGDFIKKNKMRVSMHPDQFVVLNSLNKDVVKRSIWEIEYHCKVLDLMGLDSSAKVQIHVGGVYGDKEKSISRFISNYLKLKPFVKNRLAIENDDRSYSLKDCLKIYSEIKIPIIFDTFHHECLNNGEDLRKSILAAGKTWRKQDGVLMMDYSTQDPNKRRGSHNNHLEVDKFKSFLKEAKGINCDIMLEIKDKEKSALKAINILNKKGV